MKSVLLVFLMCCAVVSKAQIITTFAGGGVLGDGNPATAAILNQPQLSTFDKFGNYYFCQPPSHKIRKVSVSGIISTVAGTGIIGFSGDGGPASSAKFRFPEGLACDTFGNLYISDHQNYRIRKVDMSTNLITTVAGNGGGGDAGDGGPGTAADFFPSDICFDSHGNLYISDGSHHKIRKVGTDGVISTYAGTGSLGFSGDGGAATLCQFWNPLTLAIDKNKNLYVADRMNKRVRKIDTFGIITTVAGTGVSLYSGDEIAATSSGIGPLAIGVDKRLNLFISDSNQRVRMVDTFGIIHTVVGTGVLGLSGDGGPATAAQISTPLGISFDACQNLYFIDNMNARIRKVTYPPLLTVPTIALSGERNMPVGSTVTVTATVTNAGSSYLIHWLNHGIEFTTTTVPMVTYTKPPGVDTITARIVPTGYGCWDSATSTGHMVMVGTTGIPSGGVADGITIYPNPSANLLHITGLPGAATYRLLSMVGAVARCGELPAGGGAAPLQGLPPGMYVLELVTERGERVVRRVVKE